MKFALAAAALLLPTLAYAQFDSTAIAALAGSPVAPLTLSLNPQYPAPYSTATLSAESTTLDLANSIETVRVNGTQIYKGNVQDLAVSIGGPAQVTTIAVSLASNGKNYSQTIALHPGGVALVEEPLSTAPPLYAGKPTVPASGSVRVVAMPQFMTTGGVAIAPANLVYSWTLDGTTLAASSGIGKSVVVVALPLAYRSREVSLNVKTQDGSIIGAASLSLAPGSPSLRIYANDPLMGILYDRALGGSYTLAGAEASFIAAPYAFSTAQGAPRISWFVNGAAAQQGATITVRPTGQGAGSAALSVSSAGSSLESAAAALTISFSAPSSGNSVFGL